jgi:hypothetical protein
MTDFRALCVELLEWAEQTSAHYVVHPDVILRARAALAEDPVGPTESDVTEMFYRHVGEGSEVGFENAIAEALARWGNYPVKPDSSPANQPEPVGPTDEE